MQRRHSINKGGEQNWVNAHKQKNMHGVKSPIFGQDFDKKKFCGWDVIDKVAEMRMSAGYNKNNKLCDKCYTLKSTSGACNCD